MSRAPAKIIFIDHTDDEAEELEFPTKFEVCARCGGTGKHTNPNIDGNGLTREDFDEDPDFAEAYFRGDYDVTCSACHGANVVPTPDWSRASFSLKRKYLKHLRREAEWAREDASEAWLRRAESGGNW